MEFSPQWMGEKSPKNFRSEQMTHAHFVAAWWARTLTQVAVQGNAEAETVSFENMLMEFLNINKIAIEQGTKVAWEYDKTVWDTTVEKIKRKEPALNIKEDFTIVNENKLTGVQKKTQSSFVPSWSKGSAGKGDQKGFRGTVKGGVASDGKGDMRIKLQTHVWVSFRASSVSKGNPGGFKKSLN